MTHLASVVIAIDPSRDVRLDRSDLGFASRAARRADRQVGENVGRARRQQEQTVAEANRIVDIVGDQQRHHGTAVHQHRDLLAQAGGEGIVERGQRFVEDQEIRLDRQRRGRARRGGRGRATVRRGNGCDVRPVPEWRTAPKASPHRPEARQAAHFLRPTARAAAAAPGTPCRSARRADAKHAPDSRDRGRRESCSMVLLPQPDGPTNTPTSPAPSVKLMPASTSWRSPAAFLNALLVMSTSSRTGPPPR